MGGKWRRCSTLRLSYPPPRAPPFNRASRPGGSASLAHARSVTRAHACALRRRPGRPSPASALSTATSADLLPRSGPRLRSGAVGFLQKEATPRLLFAARFYRRPHGFFFFWPSFPPPRLGPGRFASPVDAIAWSRSPPLSPPPPLSCPASASSASFLRLLPPR